LPSATPSKQDIYKEKNGTTLAGCLNIKGKMIKRKAGKRKEKKGREEI